MSPDHHTTVDQVATHPDRYRAADIMAALEDWIKIRMVEERSFELAERSRMGRMVASGLGE